MELVDLSRGLCVDSVCDENVTRHGADDSLEFGLMNIFSLLVLLVSAGFAGAVDAGDETIADVVVLRKAADGGDVAAKYQLGRAYFRGDGVEKDLTASRGLLEEAANAGHAEAMDAVGYFYFAGEGVPKDEALAVEWFRKAAEAGSPKGQLHLGLMLRQGRTIELSNDESLLWIQKSADGGDLEATGVLGRLYFLGDKLQSKDYAKAFPYLRTAAEAGDPICQNMVGLCYRDGVGTERDPDAAMEWLRKAALQNDRKAQSNLAHLMGVDSPKSADRKEALKWLLIASDQGEITAKKTYNEIMPTLPAALLAGAKKEADRFLLLQRAGGAKKSTNPSQKANPVTKPGDGV